MDDSLCGQSIDRSGDDHKNGQKDLIFRPLHRFQQLIYLIIKVIINMIHIIRQNAPKNTITKCSPLLIVFLTTVYKQFQLFFYTVLPPHEAHAL